MVTRAKVQVGPFRIADASYQEVVAEICRVAEQPGRVWIAAGLHVASLLHRRRPAYRAAVENSDLAYADGAAIAVLARLAGARWVQRAPLTDMGHDILSRLPASGCRLALIGGPEGLADRAARALEERHGVTIVMATHGYHTNWKQVIADLMAAEPTVVLVGLGIPLELEFLTEHRSELPPAAYLTAGGWFGHVVGDETRAPRWMRRAGLEWTWRLWQQPRRLASRYFKGGLVFLALAIKELVASLNTRRRIRALLQPKDRGQSERPGRDGERS